MITAQRFKNAVLSGANNLLRHKDEIDKLNVFPVPDGDTGTNMSMTLSAGVAALEEMELDRHSRIDEVSEKLAAAVLRGARGNSGVIVSLFFQGFAEGCKGKKLLSVSEFAAAMAKSVDMAYKAVLKPTEGTILTVSRSAAQAVGEARQQGGKEEEMLTAAFRQGEETLSKTPDMLPLLKKAGVVDAGGQGYISFFEGVMHYLRTGKIIERVEEIDPEATVADPVPLSEDEITFTYCTEFLIDKAENGDTDALRDYLSTLGDSLICVEVGGLVKVHVHTDHPGDAMEAALKVGSLEKIKIENMRLQFRARQGKGKSEEKKGAEDFSPVAVETAVGFVAVCAGDGLKQSFEDLGCHKVIFGGQTMNPSAEDILKACLLSPAKDVIVLPNNSNIVMAAQQAAKISTERTIHVIPTKTIPQGICAALNFDPDGDAESNLAAMTAALETVRSAQVTRAARDSDFEGKSIKKDEVLALSEGKLVDVCQSYPEAVMTLLDAIVEEDSFMITLFCGEDADEKETEEIVAAASERFPQAEVTRVQGDQPVYPYLISVEK